MSGGFTETKSACGGQYRGETGSGAHTHICSHKCLERREAVQIANMDPDRIINTNMEFVAPAIQRMTHTILLNNLLDDGRNRGQGQ